MKVHIMLIRYKLLITLTKIIIR